MMPVRRRVRLASLCLALAAAGCASTPAVDPKALPIGEPQQLNRECKLLGTASGRSIFGGLSDDAKIQGALANAREKAAAMGATHILVMKAETSGAMGLGEATLRAYRCDPKP